ncbi:MAG: mandelate racemase/muconate lactonizing enzyme family protein [Dehalococcoidales bacterium]|nr:mandelate racemase/muconate lactonizing enzyme family protein [Dehalococcoidales bacterium]
MKITRIQPFICSAGWRPWIFVKVETDEGIVGYGECSEHSLPRGVASSVQDLEKVLVGRDPRQVEALNADMFRVIRQSPGGVAQKAIAGIELALWDIKAKALGVPVYELFGGPVRRRIRMYWSHCGTSRAQFGQIIGTPPLRSLADVAALGKEVVKRGYTALKTNIVIPGDPAVVHMPGFVGNYASSELGIADLDLNVSGRLVNRLEDLIGTFREAVGPDVDIALDLNFNFKTEGFLRIAKAMEQFKLMWLEIDTYDPRSLALIRQSTSTPICSGENLYTPRGYRPYLEAYTMDVAMIDIPWNGFSVSKKVADLADAYEVNIAPHNYYSHLSTLISANLCAICSNIRILEVDVDDVPWKDEFVTEPPEIKDGYLTMPTKPGWGADLDEDALEKYAWFK